MGTRSDVVAWTRARGTWLALALACAAWGTAARAATDEAAGFELILLDGYEDCGLAYRDLDADTFGGDSDVRIQCPPLPSGYVAIGGDCNDANPLVNPGAAETVPDAQFLDENCDGVDGNVALAVFVAPGGSGAAGCGTRQLPCNLAVAPGRAQTLGRTQLYLGAGNHTGMPPLNGFANGLSFHGGYDANWVRAPRAVNLSRIEGAFVSQVGPVGATFSNGNYVLDELEVAAPSASGPLPDGSGAGSYGVRVLAGAALSITRSSVVAGAGFPGNNGNSGINAPQVAPTTAGPGGAGDQFLTICNDTSRGARGSAGTNPSLSCAGSRSTTGGQGGGGGLMDASCSGIGGTCFGSDCDATGGLGGGNAAFATGSFGTGGPGGAPCGTSTGADPGIVTDGGGGAGGSNARGQLSIGSATRWQGFPGNTGTLGENGGGGGGGGGAGGCDTATDSYGDGGGGGGAGGCRAPQAGTGGRPGGGSIAVFAVQASSLAISNSTVVALGGGDGGSGGVGGTGQPGGAGGPGGSGPGGANGGIGADGGRGGHAGGGGGGAGGVSVGVFAYQVSPAISNMVPQVAPAGQGGAGGAGQVGGQNGTNGAAATNLTCITPSGC